MPKFRCAGSKDEPQLRGRVHAGGKVCHGFLHTVHLMLHVSDGLCRAVSCGLGIGAFIQRGRSVASCFLSLLVSELEVLRLLHSISACSFRYIL